MATADTLPRHTVQSAYTVEPTNRVMLDGIEITVTDVHRNYNARTVTLTTDYGAPRVVTFDAAVPVLLCPHTFPDGVGCVFRAGHENASQVGGAHHWPPVITEGWAAGATDGGEWLTVHGSYYGPRSPGRVYATREAAEARAADIRARSVPDEAARIVVRRVRDEGGVFRIVDETTVPA